MELDTLIAIVSALIAGCALAVAVLQYRISKKESIDQARRLDTTVGRIEIAEANARQLAEVINLAVQRTKDGAAPRESLLDLMRIARASSIALARDLSNDAEMVRSWSIQLVGQGEAALVSVTQGDDGNSPRKGGVEHENR